MFQRLSAPTTQKFCNLTTVQWQDDAADVPGGTASKPDRSKMKIGSDRLLTDAFDGKSL